MTLSSARPTSQSTAHSTAPPASQARHGTTRAASGDPLRTWAVLTPAAYTVLTAGLAALVVIARLRQDPSLVAHPVVTLAEALVVGPVGLATTGVIAAWTHRAHERAQRITPLFRHRHEPVWSVLAWLVPPVVAWWPKEVVADIWHASSLHESRRWPPIDAWWLALVGAALAQLVGAVLLLADVRAGDEISALTTVLTLASAGLYTLALALWSRVVGAVEAAQAGARSTQRQPA